MKESLNWYSLIIWFSLTPSCKAPAPNNMEGGAVPVNLYEVKQEKAVYHDLYPGNILSLNEVHLRSEVNGYITGIFFKEGQQIRQGQKLYEIEPEKYRASYKQAVANMKIAKANLGKAAKDEKRYTALGKMDAIAKQRVDYAKTDLKNAQEQLIASRSEVVKALTDLQHSTIMAPFDGTIGISLVKSGALVTAGQTDLNTISSNDPMAVDFVISEKEIGHFQDLKKSPSVVQDSLFTISLPDGSIYPYPGKIAFFDRAVDPLTGTLRIRLQFPNPDSELKTGMSCTVQVLNKSGRNAVLIPGKAITELMGEFSVYLVQNDTARQRKVILGQTVRDKVIVASGLKPGEKIVLDGLQKLHDGSPVQTGASNPDSQKQAANK